MHTRPEKVFIITNIPNPYRVALLNEIHVQLSALDIRFKVIFGARSHSRRKFAMDMEECHFDYMILNDGTVGSGDAENVMLSYPGLIKVIRMERPDKVLIVGFSQGTMKLWFRSWIRKTRYILYGGSWEMEGRKDSFLRKIQRKLLMKRAAGCVAYGSLAKDYFIRLGAKPEKVVIGINTVDTTFFREQTDLLRKQLPVRKPPYRLIYIGYLTERKNPRQLLKVIKALSEQRHDFILDVLGDGPELEHLETYVKQEQIGNFVKFHGFIQKEKLPEYLSVSSCFLFPTNYDIWGLVLNEAMAAGLPCIASIHAGATHDLIREGETGFAVDFNDIPLVVEKINWLLDHPGEAGQMGQKARELMRDEVNLKNSAAAFIQAFTAF